MKRAPYDNRAATFEVAQSTRLERLFARIFDTLVYTQAWEDPIVDMQALALQPHHRLVGIASAGCNILTYLSSELEQIDAVDINHAHLALTHLKLAALQQLPTYEHFFQFFGVGSGQENVTSYDAFIRHSLPDEARAYWDRRRLPGGRRINMFARSFYRHGLVSRFIGLVTFLARRGGLDPSSLIKARELKEQQLVFQRHVAPIFDDPLAKRITRSPASLFALGCPPAQYQELVRASNGDLIGLLKDRIRRLACDFPISDNYFAWQVFARRYDIERRKAVPAYLQPDVYSVIRDRTDRIRLHASSLTAFLQTCPAGSVHRFVLLDSQDWMSPEELVALWQQITRTADAQDARIIFRTVGGQARLLSALPESIRSNWSYQSVESQRLHALDRSAIYGGFHLYIRTAAGVAKDAHPGV